MECCSNGVMSRAENRANRAIQFSSITPSLYYTKPVDAFLVDGEEGVFAAWSEGALVHMATGDDGSWRHFASYDSSWVPKILRVIEAAAALTPTRKA